MMVSGVDSVAVAAAATAATAAALGRLLCSNYNKCKTR